MCGVDTGEPISSSGLATNTRRANGTPPRTSRSAAIAYSPVEQAALHVGDARAGGDAALDRERSLRRGPRVEHGVHVADAQERGPGGVRPVQLADDRLAQALVVRRGSSTAKPEGPEPLRGPAADRVHAGLRVAAAVGVDEPLEVGEIGRVGPLDARPQRGELLGRDEGVVGASHGGQSIGRDPAVRTPRPPCRRRSAAVAGAVRRRSPSRSISGPCDSWRSGCSRAPTSTGCCRWSRSRSPSAGRGPGTAPGRPADGALVHLARAVPAREWPDAVADLVAWTRRLRADHGEHGGPVEVHRASDAGRWVVTWPWTGAERARLIAEAAVDLAGRSVSPARRVRLTGTQARLVAALGGAHRRGRRHAAVLDPRRGPAHARRVRSPAPTASPPSPG